MEEPMARRFALCVMLLSIPAIAGAVSVGQRAPQFSLPEVSGGGQTSLAKLKGSVVVIDFWASWCAPCLKAIPELDAMQRELGPRGLKVLAVSIDEEVSSARNALKGKQLAVTVLHDSGAKVAEQYGVGDSIPATVVIDREGKVRLFKKMGVVERSQLRRLINKLL